MLAKVIKNKKGFTLMEMLIVVAIMVVLVAVAVPTFTTQIGTANLAADDANFRAGKALATAMFMTGEEGFSEILYYDVAKTSYVSVKPEPYGKTEDNDGKVISAKVNDAGDGVDVQWE